MNNRVEKYFFWKEKHLFENLTETRSRHHTTESPTPPPPPPTAAANRSCQAENVRNATPERATIASGHSVRYVCNANYTASAAPATSGSDDVAMTRRCNDGVMTSADHIACSKGLIRSSDLCKFTQKLKAADRNLGTEINFLNELSFYLPETFCG